MQRYPILNFGGNNKKKFKKKNLNNYWKQRT